MSETISNQGTSSEAPATNYHRCEDFPDVCPTDTRGLDGAELGQAVADNNRRALMYRAIQYILVKDFGFPKALPATVDKFPGNIEPRYVAQYLAVHGLMLADNYADATLGKDRRTGDDVYVPDEDPSKSFFIARRFLDAVVKKVQEYTAQDELFYKVYTMMLEEGAQRNGSTLGPKPSTMARV